MIVSELMKPDPATVAPDTTVVDAARIMLALRVSGLPVVEGGRLVGMVTEGDLLRRPELGTADEKEGWLAGFFTPSRLAAQYAHSHGKRVKEVMSSQPASVAPDTKLAAAAKLMMAKKFKRLPVLKGQELVGMLSRTDLLAALVHRLIELPDQDIDDEAAKTYIDKELATHSWTPKVGLHVRVADHVATLEGSIYSDAERDAVRVIVENAPGVREVVDHLVYVDPGSGMAFPAG